MRTQSTSQTQAAGAAAPPRKQFGGLALIIAGPVAFALLAYPAWDLGVSGYGSVLVNIAIVCVLAIMMLLIGGVLLPGDLQYNSRVFPKALARWSRSWKCQRCGSVEVF